jgi:hypothetical protein
LTSGQIEGLLEVIKKMLPSRRLNVLWAGDLP